MINTFYNIWSHNNLPEKKSLEDTSWEEISIISQNHQSKNYWNIGDCKSIHINGTIGPVTVDYDVYAMIIGFDHNSALEGSGTSFIFAHKPTTYVYTMSIIDSNFTNIVYDGSLTFNMNHWGELTTNKYQTTPVLGGWSGCDTRYDILGSTDSPPSNYGIYSDTTIPVGVDASVNAAISPVPNTYMSILPNELRSVMKPIRKYQDDTLNQDSPQDITFSIDYLPLLSIWELNATGLKMGASYATNPSLENYQKQYDYFRLGNPKYAQNLNTTTRSNYYLRNIMTNKYQWAYFGNTVTYQTCAISRGMCPIFLV